MVVKYGNDAFVEMIIQTKGIAFGYSTIDRPSWWHARIGPEIRISSMDFFSAEAYQPMLDSGAFSFGVLDGVATLARMQLWRGYGDLAQYRK